MKINKEEVINEVKKDIIDYSKLLKKTKVMIKEEEWNAFFEALYCAFEEREQLHEYFGALEGIIADAFLQSQYRAAEGRFQNADNILYTITLYDILCSLKLLKLFHFDDDEIVNVTEKIIELSNWQVIEILNENKKKKLYIKSLK